MILPKLSFCIPYNSGLSVIKEIIQLNLDSNRMLKDYIEFVVIDFGNLDDLHCWIAENFKEDLEKGYLKFSCINKRIGWHESVVKNIVTQFASNDILINIDCGFIVDFITVTSLIKLFAYDINAVVHINTRQERNHYGHVAIHKNNFRFLGGYDESFDPVGYQTMDLINRLKNAGINYIPYLQKGVDYSLFKESLITGGYTNDKYNEMLQDNYIKSKENIAQGYLVANNGSYGLKHEIYV